MEQIEKIQGTEKEFIKVFQELCYSRSSWQVWADLMAAMACTLANSVDITYADEAVLEEDKEKMTVRFWKPVMKKGGIIEFIRPEECTQKRHIREMKRKIFGKDNFTGLQEFTSEEVGE